MYGQEKANLISAILQKLKFSANNEGKEFDEGSTWFSLACRTGAELEKIAKLSGV